MRNRLGRRRLRGLALLAAIPILAACTVTNDPDGWAPPIATELDGRPIVIARVEDNAIAAIDLDRANPVVWMFPGAAAGQAPAQDDERPFPGLDEQVEAQGFYGAPAVIGADARRSSSPTTTRASSTPSGATARAPASCSTRGPR